MSFFGVGKFYVLRGSNGYVEVVKVVLWFMCLVIFLWLVFVVDKFGSFLVKSFVFFYV